MLVEDYQENYYSGWIKIFRSVSKKGWYLKSDYVHLWIHILIKANHKTNYQFMFNGENITLKQGQFITGRKVLSNETGINESKIERILTFFEKNEQQIEQQKTNKNRLITVLNWDNYQTKENSEQQSEQQVNNKRTTSEQQVNTYKNDKNKKNDKNIIPPSIEMLEKYSTTRGSKVDINRFYDFYESKNWMVGKSKMKDWQAAYRNWEPEKKKVTDPFLKF